MIYSVLNWLKKSLHKIITCLLRISRTAPFVLVYWFAGDVQGRSIAKELITMREKLLISLIILVWIMVGFSAHILSTD